MPLINWLYAIAGVYPFSNICLIFRVSFLAMSLKLSDCKASTDDYGSIPSPFHQGIRQTPSSILQLMSMDNQCFLIFSMVSQQLLLLGS